MATLRSRHHQAALPAADASAEPPAETAYNPETVPTPPPVAVKKRFPFHQDDLRFKHLETDTREDSNAVVICIMDTSGSMDTMKKYLARSFFFMLYQFIATRYRNVEIVFIGHHTEATEVTEEEFFHKGEAGGTFISSGYQKALDIIAERYHPSLWNIYAFHCSDGDNFDSDNPAALRTAKELCEVCNLFGYGEIKPLGSRYYESSMLNVFRRLDAPNFQAVLIERKEDIWPSFKAFLSKDRIKEAS
jgi:sporulation protein YhbH